jgi:hypothetical protein
MGWWDGWQGPDKWIFGPLPPELHEVWERSGRSFVVLAGLGWRMLVEAFEAARALTPAEQWIDLRYEDLLDDPRREIARVLDHAGLVWDARFEEGYARHTIERHRTDAYRSELTAAQVRQLEDVIAEPLARWGYTV